MLNRKLFVLIVLPLILTLGILQAARAASPSCPPGPLTVDNAGCAEKLGQLGHGSYTDAAWSPDGTSLALGSTLGIWLYDASHLDADPQLLLVVGDVQQVRFSPSGRLLASVGLGGGTIWDIETSQQRFEIDKRALNDNTVSNTNRWIKNLTWAPDDRFILVEEEGSISLWDVALQWPTFETVASGPTALSQDGKLLLFIDQTNSKLALHVWEIEANHERLTIPLEDFTSRMTISPDGQSVVTAFNNPNTGQQGVNVWSTTTGQEVASSDVAPDAGFYAAPMVFNPGGSVLAYSRAENETIPGFTAHLRLWNLKKDKITFKLGTYTSPIQAIAFSPDGRLVATTEDVAYNMDKSYVRIWDSERGTRVGVSTDLVKGGHVIAFSPDGKQLLSLHEDGIVRLWDSRNARLIQAIGQGNVLTAITPDGQSLALMNASGEIRLWSLSPAGYKEIAKYQASRASIQHMALSPDGRHVAFSQGEYYDHKTDGRFHTLQVWDSKAGSTRMLYQDDTHEVGAVTFSPDGQSLAAALDDPQTQDAAVQFWNVASGKKSGVPFVAKAMRVSLAFSPDGMKLASGACGGTNIEGTCNKGEIFIWDVKTARVIAGPLYDHTSAVTALAFTPDGQQLASGSGRPIYYGSEQDYSVVLWNAATGTRIGSPLLGHGGEVQSLAFNVAGTLLAVGSGNSEFATDSTVKLWDVTHQRLLCTLNDYNTDVTSLAFDSPGRLVAASGDGTVRYWGIPEQHPAQSPEPVSPPVTVVVTAEPPPQNLKMATQGKTLAVITPQNASGVQALARYGRGALSALAWSPDGKHIGVAGGLGIWLYEVQGQKISFRLIEHGAAVGKIAFSPNGKWIGVTCSDNTVRVWETSTGAELFVLRLDHPSVQSVAFSPDSRYIAAGGGANVGNDRSKNWVSLWDTASKKQLFLVSGSAAPVMSLAFSPDGKLLAGGEGIIENPSEVLGVQLWAIPSGKPVDRLVGHELAVEAVAFSPNRKLLASSGMDRTIKVWDVSSHDLLMTLDSHTSFVSAVTFSPDGKTLASGSYDGTVRLWDMATGRERRTLLADTRTSNGSLSFSPDGRQLAVMRTQDDFVIVDVETGAITFDVKAHSSPWSSVALSPDGKSIYASTVYNSVRRWNSGDGQEADVWQGIDDFVFGGTFSPDLTRFASAGFLGIGLVINQFDTETFCIQAITFSPDGKSLASADRGDTTSTIKLWDVATQKLIRAFDASKNWIGYLVFSLDGKWIASASREGAIEVWDTTTGKLHSRYDYGLWALALAFSPDSRLLAVGGGLFTEQEAVIRIVDLNGHEQTSLPAHSLSVYALAFSPNGTVLATANGEGSISLWDISAVRELNRLQGASIGESALLFNEQGNLLISAGDDGVVRLWGVFADIF